MNRDIHLDTCRFAILAYTITPLDYTTRGTPKRFVGDITVKLETESIYDFFDL